ncbi:MAG: endonuclease/exonuclease/phosphatase family protein [Pseudomonadota bacterium]
MRILCLNGWGGVLHEPLLAYLAQTQPDVLCLQEVTHTPWSHADWLIYRDPNRVLDQRASTLRDIRSVLPEHQWMFCPMALGPLWDGDIEVTSHWGLATFVRQDIPVIGQRQDFVHGVFSPDGFGEEPRARSAHGVRLFDPDTRKTVSITQTHGLRDPRGKIDTPERRAQVEALIALSASVSEPGDLRVICGDLNVEPESETLTRLKAAGFVDLVTSGDWPGTRTSHYTKPGRFADYMLIDDPSMVEDFSVVYEPEMSDHCPLVLTL